MAALTIETFSEGVRKTTETPPRGSVFDVIMKVKGCDSNYTDQTFRRLLAEGLIPECEEVPQNLIHANCMNQTVHGEVRRPVLVATAQEMVEILFALPGNAEFRKNSAQLVVRYLGGDIGLVEEIFQLRAAQQELAVSAPEHPARIFGEAVGASGVTTDAAEDSLTATDTARKRLLNEMRELVRGEMRQNHVWSFSKRSRNYYELAETGHIVHGDDLRRFDEAEHIVRVEGFLAERCDPAVYRLHGRKFKNIYAVELKRAKLRESRDEGLPPPVAFNQGEYRIIYTEADYELMVQTLEDCRERFEAIAGRDQKLFSQSVRGQRSNRDFMCARMRSEAE